MPASFLMKWEPKNGLWRKMYKGRRYVISCRQLSGWSGDFVPETKEGSYQSANAWWLTKKAEIDGQRPPHPHATEIDEYLQRRDYFRRHGDADQAKMWDTQARYLEENPKAKSLLELNRDLRIIIAKKVYGSDLANVPPVA